MNTSSPLNQLQHALQQLTGSQQSQQQQDPTSLFTDLLHGAMTNKDNPQQNWNVNPGIPLNLGRQSQQHPLETQATAQAIHNGADPSLLDQAKQMLGKNSYIGLCEAFVEHMTRGMEGIYRSASDAWNQQSSRKTGLSGINPGDSVYFAPDASNGYNGHTGVYQGNNKFVSATYNGIKQYDLNDWQKMTGQKLLGYVPSDNRTVKPRNQLYGQVQAQRPPTTNPMTSQMPLKGRS